MSDLQRMADALERIKELEDENAELRSQLSMVQLRQGTLGIALQSKQGSGDDAKLEFAAKLEAYLLGSHAQKVEDLVSPPEVPGAA